MAGLDFLKIPLLSQLRAYKKEYLTKDLIAGFTVAVVLIPQSMAYALVAGLPPVYGLYAASIPVVVAALFQSTPQLAIGPVAIVAFLTYSFLIGFVKPSDPLFIDYAIIMAFFVGLVGLFMGVFKLGFLLRFVSHAVVIGFSNAAAIIIASTQVPSLLGIKVEQKSYVFQNFYEIGKNLINTNLYTLAVGIGSMLVIVGLRKIHKNFPSALVAVILFTFLSYTFDFQSYGISVVGDIPSGLPLPSFPNVFSLEPEILFKLIPGAFIIAIIGFMESYSISKIMSTKTGIKSDTNQDLISQGIGNLVASVFKGFPISGSFSRSAINLQAGAVTNFANVISALLVILTIFAFSPLLYYLPKATLAALVITAVIGIMKLGYFGELWHTSRPDAIASITTFAFAFITKPDYAILIGMLLALALFLWNSLYPRIVALTRDPKSKTFVNAQANNLPECPQITIVRPEASFYYANVENIVEEFEDLINKKPALKHFVIDGEGINSVDITAVEALQDFIKNKKSKGINVVFVNLKGVVRNIFAKAKLIDMIGEENFLPSKGAAVDVLFDKIDHNYCRQECPYAVFDECYTVKEYIKFLPVEEEFVNKLYNEMHTDQCEVLMAKKGNFIRVECGKNTRIEFKSSHFAKDEKGRIYLYPSGNAKIDDEFVNFGTLAKNAQLEFFNGYILISKNGSLKEAAKNIFKMVEVSYNKI